ncbi:MAG: hypothetical protein C4313_01515 [Thermoflexus sp.]|uniref:hypothetical protein n=1 Tax=Thermoflexus sp. TaxID=1969742 RepID=UPI003330BFB9
MFEDIRQHLSEVPEGEVIEEKVETEPSSGLPGGLTFLKGLTPMQRLILGGLLLLDLCALAVLLLLVVGVL